MRPPFSVPPSRRLGIELVALAVIVVLAVAAAPAFASGTTPFQQVLVVNTASSPVPVTLQGTGAISGTVNVGNFPSTQPVSGTLNVGNLPSTQPVSGTVGVNNFPATQNVNVTGGSLSTSQQVSNRIFQGEGEPRDETLDILLGNGTTTGTAGSPFNLTAISIDDFGGSDNLVVKPVIVVSAGSADSVVIHRGNDYFVTFPQPIAATDLDVQCGNSLIQGDCHFLATAIGYPSP